MSVGAKKKKRNWSAINRGKFPNGECSVCGHLQSVFYIFCKDCGVKLRDRTREFKVHYANTQSRYNEETLAGTGRYILASPESYKKLRANSAVRV